MSTGKDVTVENISSEKKGDSYITHWKFNKKVPMQFTMVDPSSIKSTYGKKPPKSNLSVNTQHYMQPPTQQVQFVQQKPIQHTFVDSQNILSQRRNSAPVVTLEEQGQPTDQPSQQQTYYQRSPLTQYSLPNKQSRKRSIHDMNEHMHSFKLQKEFEMVDPNQPVWYQNNVHNRKTKHHAAKWRERMDMDDSAYGSEYVETLTPEQQAYIRGGRSRSVPAHVLSQQIAGMEQPPHIPSSSLAHYSFGARQNYSPQSPTVLPPILPSISELRNQVDHLQDRRGSIDELSINFSTRATVENESSPDDILNEDMQRRIRRRVSYTEEMNTIELMKERRRGSQPNAHYPQYQMGVSSPTQNIAAYTFPLKHDGRRASVDEAPQSEDNEAFVLPSFSALTNECIPPPIQASFARRPSLSNHSTSGENASVQ